MHRSHVLVCGGAGRTSFGNPKIMEALQNEIKEQGLEEEVAVVGTGCHGLCALGPIMIVYPDVTLYFMARPEDIPEIVAEHLLKSHMVTRLFYQGTISPSDGIKALSDTDFYKRQYRTALHNCGIISPESIEEYIGTNGYQVLGKVLTETIPNDMVQTLLGAGLRGHGGTGFPTGLEQELCKQNDADQKYVCCNTNEGDPGAFMDRSVLEGDPHTLSETMATAGYAIGSNQGYVYVHIEYPIAMECLKIAISQAREMELLSKNIFRTGFDSDVDIRLDAEALVCSEETVLMASIEGKHGEPRLRPPFPAQKGLFGKPSILNNVKTCANILQIILNGPEWFASVGTEKLKGTKVFALDSKINNTGLVEVPMGAALRIVIDEIGGGIPSGKKFKAAQIGGPSGGCIPAEHFDIPIDYDNLPSINSTIGSDGLIVMDEDNCMADIARFPLGFTVEESCGKRTACRIGTKRMLETLEEITKGTAKMADLDRLKELCHYVKTNPLRGLGQIVPNPVLSILYFLHGEYEAHIKEKRCPAGICKVLLSYVIDYDEYRGCTLCAHTCPADATVGSVKSPRITDLSKCIKCGACMGKCRFDTTHKK